MGNVAEEAKSAVAGLESEVIKAFNEIEEDIQLSLLQTTEKKINEVLTLQAAAKARHDELEHTITTMQHHTGKS